MVTLEGGGRGIALNGADGALTAARGGRHLDDFVIFIIEAVVPVVMVVFFAAFFAELMVHPSRLGLVLRATL